MPSPFSYLFDLIGLQFVKSANVAVPRAATLNFTEPLEAEYNPTTGAIDVSATAPVADYSAMLDLRAVDPINGAAAATRSHTTLGDEGGGPWRGVTGASPGTYTHNGGTVIVPSGGNGSSAWLRDFVGPIHLEWFGSDAATALPLAFAAIDARGGGTVQLPAGTLGPFTANITPPSAPCVIRGMGKGVTILDWSNEENLFTTGTQAYHTQSHLTFEDFTVIGEWDALESDEPFVMPFNLYGIDLLAMNRVEVKNCTFFGMVIRQCERVMITGCSFSEMGRDSISCNTCNLVIIDDNEIDHCDDDAITCHGQLDSPGGVRGSVIITNNRLTDAHGIACNGGRKVVIDGNQIDRSRLAAVAVGTPPGNQMLSYALTISNNVITNVINRAGIDGLNSGASYILINSDAQAGLSGTVPGLPAVGTGVFTPLYESLLNHGATAAYAPSTMITVTGNTLARTLPETTNYSDYGFGEMFTRNGWLDPEMTNAELGSARGINVLDGIRDTNITGNTFRGMDQCIIFNGTTTDVRNVQISTNEFIDFDLGIAFSSGVTKAHGVKIHGNTFDGDPEHKHPNRGSGGTWAAAADGPVALFVQNASGIEFNDNTVRRVSRISETMASGGSNRVSYRDNTWECNPVAVGFSTSNIGIGEVPRGSMKGVHKIVDDDPASATWDEVLNECEVERNTIPTAGTYVAGHYVRNSGPSMSSAFGWLRMTTGSGHVVGTDWREERGMAVGTVLATLTIASGAVTWSDGTLVRVDTEASAASDDLDTISGVPNGTIIVLQAANDGRTIVAKDTTGNLRLAGDFSLDHTNDRLLLHSDGTNLYELARSDNAT